MSSRSNTRCLPKCADQRACLLQPRPEKLSTRFRINNTSTDSLNAPESFISQYMCVSESAVVVAGVCCVSPLAWLNWEVEWISRCAGRVTLGLVTLSDGWDGMMRRTVRQSKSPLQLASKLRHASALIRQRMSGVVAAAHRPALRSARFPLAPRLARPPSWSPDKSKSAQCMVWNRSVL